MTVGEKVSILQENESTYIPAGTSTASPIPGKVPLELVEIQCGPISAKTTSCGSTTNMAGSKHAPAFWLGVAGSAGLRLLPSRRWNV